MLPTPRTSQDYKKIRRLSPSERDGRHGATLVGAIGEMMLPTPTAMGDINSPERTERAISLAKQNKPLYTRRIVNGKKIPDKRTFGIKDAILYNMMLPTPTAEDAAHTPTAPTIQKYNGGRSLNAFVGRMLPTPTVDTSKNNFSPSQLKRDNNLPKTISDLCQSQGSAIGKDARLRPQFVEWMMGFPIGWLNLEL